jgi:hypothetical protein
MLTSRTRLIAAAFAGSLSFAACAGGGGSPSMTPLAQSVQTAPQNKTNGTCKTLPLINSKTPLEALARRNAAPSSCGIRNAHKIASGSKDGNLQVFDVPGAISVSNCSPYELFNDCGTFGLAINAPGTIVGWYLNTNDNVTAFLRTADANYTSFEAQGDEATNPYDITDAGAIAGQFVDETGVLHGFVRHRDGSFLTYQAPWASQVPNDSVPQGTSTGAINARGETGGIYFDSQGSLNGFIRHRNGSFVQVIPDGAVSSSVCIACLNDRGTAAGDYTGSDGIGRGFIRSPRGTIRTIEKRGALDTGLSGINNGNTVTGFYIDKNSALWGFIQGGGQRRIVFQDPKASETYGAGTEPEAINDADAVTGVYADAQGAIHGFYRSPTGQFSEFDPKGSVYTLPYAINDSGTVTGYWYDAQGGTHGFIWSPHKV